MFIIAEREDKFYIAETVRDEEGKECLVIHGEGDWLRAAVEAEVERLNTPLAA